MQIRPASFGDVKAAAKLHVAAFPNFFLTSLGEGFLRELYSGFLRNQDGIFLVAEDDGKLIGFAAGACSPGQFFSRLKKQRGVYFLVKAIPAIFRDPVIVLRKLYGAIFYRGDKPASIQSGALLSSIGVHPDVVGQAVGAQLLGKFEAAAFCRGAAFVYLTTDEIGNDRVNAFYRKNGYREESRFIQQKNRPMLRYVKKLIRQVNHRSEG